MRRLAVLLAALAAVACSSKKQDGDRTPPAPPVVLVPANGASLFATDLVDGQVAFSGTAEPGAAVDLQIDGVAAGSRAADAGGAWSIAAPVTGGSHTARARATDAAGNASGYGAAVAFTLDLTRLATPLLPGSTVPVTSFAQTRDPLLVVQDASGIGEVFPGQANTWVLDRDFSLATGFGLQYVNGLVLYTGTPTESPSPTHAGLVADLLAGVLDAFPGDQDASEPVFLTPRFGAADGVVTAAASNGLSMGVPAISGTSGYLNGTSDSRLSRALSLTAGETYTFRWTHQAVLRSGKLAGANVAPYAPSYQVVLRDPASGAVLGTPLFSSAATVSRATEVVTRSGLPPSVVLSFELRSAAEAYAQIDDVTLADGTGPVALSNGDFESGLADWQANGGAESQNVRSAPRDVGTGASALRITRTFYAPPAAAWGRVVDVFENLGAAPVTTSAVYVTLLTAFPGSARLAVVRAGGAVAWDAAAFVRDVGIAFGTGTALVEDGSPFLFVVHDLTVPAGGRVALAHFVVQLGEADGGLVSTDVPPATDSACAAIAAGFPAVEAYRTDLEPGVLDRVANF